MTRGGTTWEEESGSQRRARAGFWIGIGGVPEFDLELGTMKVPLPNSGSACICQVARFIHQ